MVMIAKKALKGISVIHVVFWIGLLLWCIIDTGSCTDTVEEPLGYFLEQGIHVVVAIATGAGAATAGMLSVSVFRFFRPGCTKLRSAVLATCVLDNILLYASVYFVFFVNRGNTIIFPCLWLICSIICGVLLFADS